MSLYAARTRSGIARLDIRFFPRENLYTFMIKTYTDLSSATRPEMALQFVVGNDAFLNASVWDPESYGWILQLPGAPLPGCPQSP